MASTSFKLANDQPIVFKNFQEATNKANKKLKFSSDEDEDPDDIIKEIVATKRKKYDHVQPKKKLKNHSTPIVISPKKTSRGRDESSTRGQEMSSIDDDIDWSDDGEFFRNVSLLDVSKMSSCSPKKRHKQAINDDITGMQEFDSGAGIPSDDEQWSDCDTELNISIARLDRSALHEISNLSRQDQLVSDNQHS